jgi:hypothetical protein
MSGKNYQTYAVQRIGKQPRDPESECERFNLPVLHKVPESLGRKVRVVSAKARLSEQIIAREAIVRGFALLKS